MKNNSSKKQVNTKNHSDNLATYFLLDNIVAYVVIIAFLVIPLIGRGMMIEYYSPTIANPSLDSGTHFDFFSYIKLICLIVTFTAILFLFIYKLLFRKYILKSSYANLPLGILVILTLVSGLAAQYKYVALMGVIQRFEGLIAWLCYFGIFFICINTEFSKKTVKYLGYSMIAVITVNAFLSISYFFGSEPLNNVLIRSIYLPASVKTFTGSMPTTLYNPNYLSGFAAVVFSYFVIEAFVSDKLKASIAYLVAATVSFALTLTTLSSSGFLTIIVMIPLLMLLGIMSVPKKKLALYGILILILCSSTFWVFSSYNTNVKSETIGMILNSQPSNHSLINAADRRQIIMDRKDLNVPQSLIELPKTGFSFGTGRFFIWDKTLTLIKARPFLGYGPDTLVYYFPQNDISVGTNLGSYDVIVDKPHSLFFGVAYNFGIPALICFVFLLLVHFYKTLRLFYLNRQNLSVCYLQIALFTTWSAFLIQYFLNDSTIGTSFIFWVIFGVSVSINRSLESIG